MAGALLLAAPAMAQGPEAGTSKEATNPQAAEARTHFERGTKLFDERLFAQARGEFLKSFQLWPSYDTAGLLGQTELEMRFYRDAAEHLDYCVRNFPTGANRDLFESVTAALRDVKQHVGTVTITADQAGPEILVDGDAVGRAPLSHHVFVDPGQHLVEARVAGQKRARRPLTIAAGEKTTIDLTVGATTGAPNSSATATSGATGSTTAPPFADEPAPSERNWVPAYILGGVTVAAGVTSLVFRGMANSDADEVDRLKTLLAPGECDAGPSPRCEAVQDKIDSNVTNGLVSNVALIATGVGAAATIGYVAYELFQAEPSTELTAAPLWNPAGGGGVVVTGSF